MTDLLGPAAAANTQGINVQPDANPTDTPQQKEAAAMAQYNSSPELQNYVRTTYGYDAWMLNNPELLPIIVSAAVNGWGQNEINGALESTNWWQQNGATVRQFQQEQATDPASAAQTVQANKNTIQAQAEAIGVQLDDGQLTNLATQASMFQWDAASIDQALRQSYSLPGNVAQATGSAAEIEDAVRQTAGQYLIPASDQMIGFWVQNAVRGGQDATEATSEMKNAMAQSAAQRFPWMATAIQAGMTPQQYLDPYTQQAAKTLSVSPDSIDWNDPKWQGALLTPGIDGQQVPVNSDQFNKNLMQTPSFGYSKTQGAIDQAYSTIHTIEQTFGASKL